MRALLAVAFAAAALAVPPARAEEIVRHDRQGREIHFDVRTGADVGWYAAHLSRAPHGDEISEVTIRIVTWGELAETCGGSAGGCYSQRRGGPVLIVPAGRSRGIAHTLLHEYAHHIDHELGHRGLDEPNGTPLWWAVRGMGTLLRAESVAFDYDKGWDRSVGEIFAEDYARLQLGSRYRIDWLSPPDAIVRRAILADLGLGPPPAVRERPPALRPVVITRSGRIAAGERISVEFGLLGPNRRVRFTASLAGSDPGGRMEVTCDGRKGVRGIRTAATLELVGLGPGRCRAWLVSTSTAPQAYSIRVALSLARPS